MDERYLRGHKCLAPMSLPFLSDLHAEVAVLWRHQYSAWVANMALSYSNVERLCEQGSGRMPQVEGNLASYFSPETSVLPSKPCEKDIEASWQSICSGRPGQRCFTYDGCNASLPGRPIERLGSGKRLCPEAVAELRIVWPHI